MRNFWEDLELRGNSIGGFTVEGLSMGRFIKCEQVQTVIPSPVVASDWKKQAFIINPEDGAEVQ